ncbi:MAG: lipoprotein signal peptidase [Bacteroidetes bacterium GWF2_42_66]|nr:MAG: lipoprotein signal peptidase [Bacteroidetes bacterium GWA2_42_15]OFX98527.1 MAG: lipoprotein signal peptidase [Bacteroidetes bacterium GWE2_42_39]OFY42909.1 MAG: lipoprotein signal peptidase [Bacteroidetes bacterium GWF2_42_66]HBL74396.1 lipoprotein signal peptidase [Prolixibacteraceae bacterium]HCR92237.1 lipoprotein signal peptidase [Prolixibacteraceae bacterium]
MSRLTKSILIVTLILVADQILKIWIKTSMSLGEEFSVIGNWFIIHFVENNGMAFGFEFAGQYGKIFLSVFRILAVIAIGWYLLKLIKKELPMGFIICVSLIFAGAIGNIIDSAFYGLIFSDSYGKVATLFSEGGGYATFLHGRVVDMFYFPLIQGRYPEWVPFWGGNDFLFFRPVFNIADSSITVGIFSILIFYRKLFNQLDKKPEEEETAEPAETATPVNDVPEN